MVLLESIEQEGKKERLKFLGCRDGKGLYGCGICRLVGKD